MPKNKGKGGKKGRRGKTDTTTTNELVFKTVGQEYAQIVKILGGEYVQCYCFDGVQRLCHIRGAMRKRVWLISGDIILIGLREYQDNKADVLLKYSPSEVRMLKSKGLLPNNIVVEEKIQNDGVLFISHSGTESEGNVITLQDEQRYKLPSDSTSESIDLNKL